MSRGRNDKLIFVSHTTFEKTSSGWKVNEGERKVLIVSRERLQNLYSALTAVTATDASDQVPREKIVEPMRSVTNPLTSTIQYAFMSLQIGYFALYEKMKGIFKKKNDA